MSVFLILAVVSGSSALAKTEKSVFVDCSSPQQTVQAAVDGVSPGLPTTIFVTGECLEDVTIAAPAVTLSGDPDGLGVLGGAGTIVGQVTVAGADNVAIRFLTLTGAGHGLVLTDGATVQVAGNILEENELSGLVVSNASVARLSGNYVIGNGGSGGGGGGPILNSTEPTSGDHGGISLFRNAVAELHCNNLISGNGGIEVQIEDGSVLHQKCEPTIGGGPVEPDQIDGGDPAAGGAALVVFNGSSMDLNGATIFGLSLVYGNASLRAETSIITGDIQAATHGLVGFGGGVDFTGMLICDESSGTFGTLLGLDGIVCGGGSDPDVPPIN